MRIVFMGTPDFAVPCLEALYAAGHEIVAVFTQEDKPAGRKQLLSAPPVKLKALELNIPVYQPATLKSAEIIGVFRSLAPDAAAVAAYGKILPHEMLEIPRYGCLNLHASLLPKYRGASPIQSAVTSGETVTGVTVMQMDEGLDTGDILLQRQIPIRESDNAVSLSRTLSLEGARLFAEAFRLLESGELNPEKQDESRACRCGMLRSDSGKITRSATEREAFNLVRGLLPWPCAFFTAAGKQYKVFSAKEAGMCDEAAGTLFARGGNLYLSCKDGSILIEEIQPEGKRRMSARDFLNGFSRMLPIETED